MNRMSCINLEFDLHKRNFLLTRLSNDWHVYHHIFDNNSSYSSFREVLTDLKAFKNKNPSHQLITVFLDTDGFDGNNKTIIINMSRRNLYPDGMYIVKIVSQDQVKTYNIIKE